MTIRRRPSRPPIGSNSPDLALPKSKPGESREDKRSSKRYAHKHRVAVVRARVWHRSGGRCEVCGDSERDTLRKHGAKGRPCAHQMHEIESRAQTRGRPAEERFSTKNCMRICPFCHDDVTENRVEIVVGEKGADGFIQINRKRGKPNGPMV